MSKSFLVSKNPILNEDKLREFSRHDGLVMGREETTTISGAVNKSLILIALLIATGLIGFAMPTMFLLIVGVVGGLIAVLVATFKPHTAPIAAPIYAALEGLALGVISAMYAGLMEGIILQAITLTVGTLVTMLVLYKSGLITVTQKFRSGVMMATGAIFLVYLTSFIGSFFGFNVPYLHEGGTIGIGISVVIIGVAALNLLLDFDNFEKAEEAQAPKYMEWFCALSLIVTLVWLYIEFLRLLSKLRD